MKSMGTALVGGGILLVALGTAWAQSSNPNASANGATSVSSQTTTQPADASTQTTTDMTATMGTASNDADAAMKAIRDRAKNASSKGRALVDKQLAKVASDVDANATANGKAEAAGRVASEFGMTADALAAETDQFGAGLGEVVIAHTLMANSKTAVTMDQLFAMRKDGMGWGQIAQGLNLRMGEVVSACTSEGKVAQGLMKADGKTAMIHSNTSVHAGTSTTAGAKMGHAGTSAAGSVGVGVGTKLGK